MSKLAKVIAAAGVNIDESMGAGRAALFFFKGEDGIRDSSVTGVQTCALPISADRGTAGLGRDVRPIQPRLDLVLPRIGKLSASGGEELDPVVLEGIVRGRQHDAAVGVERPRSEERRVGKECRSRWSPYH